MANLKLPKLTDPEWTFTHRPGGWIIAERKSKSERIRFQAQEIQGEVSIHLQGQASRWKLDLGRAGSSGAADANAALVALFPGKVRKILVAEGASVQEGDKLVLVEAMKMEFAVSAPAAGKVKKILVQEGQQLSPGDRFVDFEGTKSG